MARRSGRASPKAEAEHGWHLAEDPAGVAMTDLEYAILRAFEAFSRWQSECFGAVSGANVTGPENVLLHVVAMKDRPKTIHDILLLTNRNDTTNVHYGLRKLTGLGLVVKEGAGRTGVYYRCTPEGERLCRAYAALRKRLLLAVVASLPKFISASEQAAAHLEAIEKAYAAATREAATFHRR